MTDLVSVDEVEVRCPYPFDDPHVRGVAAAAISDASDLARHYGLDSWHASMVPPVVKTEVRNAVVRYMVLLDGVVQARSGDESEMFSDMRTRTGTVFFTDEQKETIRAAAGRSGNFGSLSTYRYSQESAYEVEPPVVVKMPLGKGFPVLPSASGGGW